jgi:hypothetical protein
MWRGFLVESKAFMGYSNLSLKHKIQFWLIYPIAYIKFNYCLIFHK